MRHNMIISKILILVVLFSALSVNVLHSQTYIKGVVVDSLQVPIIGVAVVMQGLDSVYINAISTDTLGQFNMKREKDSFRLIFQHLIYETKEIEVSDNYNIGTIILDEKKNLIGEVVVKGERPQVKIQDGALQYDVSRITDNKAISNAYETLLHLPGVNEQDGSLSLIGTNELTVLLNGKPTTMSSEQLSNLLKNTPASKVDKAEVVYNAPARYHVRGAVINLVMKKNALDNRLQGEVNAAYNQKYYANTSGGVSLSYSAEKFSSDFLYSYNYIKSKSGLDLYSNHLLNSKIHIIEQNNRGGSKMSSHNIRLGLNYDFSFDNKLSFTYTGECTPNKRSNQYSLGSLSESAVLGESKENMSNLNLDYSAGFGLNAGIDYTHYNSPRNQNFKDRNIENEAIAFIANSNQTINRWKAYISQNHTLSNDLSINYGGEFSFVDNDSHQIYDTEKGEDMSDSDSKSNIKEYTYNLYGGIDKKWGNFSLSLSIAGEYYEIDKKGDWSIYPMGQLTYMKSPKHILQLSFASNKSYPGYWQWQDNVSYLNGYTEIHGNPHLKPAKKYATRFNYIMRSKYVFSLYYNEIKDYFIQLPYQSPDRLMLVYQTQNIDTKQGLGVTAVVPFRIGQFINSNLTVDGSYNREKSSDFHDLSFDKTKWRIFARLDNTINISSSPDIKLEIAGMYMSPLIQGVYDMTEMWQIDAGIKWALPNRKAELRLKATDIFNSFIPDMKVHFASQNLDVLPIRDNRSVMLSFSYKFGDYKKKESKDLNTSRFGR